MDITTLGTVIYDTIKTLLVGAWTGDYNANSHKLTNLAAPSSANDAARKTDVDTASTAASSAASAAATAQSTASGAAGAASTAQSAANAAQADANTALARVLPIGGATGEVLAKASGTDYDAEWVAAGGGGDVPSTRNLTAGSGLTGGGTLAADRSFAVDFGTGATQVRAGNDAAYTNARTPSAHAASHANGAADEISVAGLSGVLADAQVADTLAASGGNLTLGAIGDGEVLIRSGSTVVSAAIGGDITAVTAGTGLTGGGTSGAVTVSANVGTSSGTLAAGDDSRFVDDRVTTGLRSATTVVSVSAAAAPSVGHVLTATGASAATWQAPAGGGGGAHASSHENGGADEINVAGLSGVLADAQKANVIAAGGGDLTVGAISDGHMLVRSGSTVVSAAIPTGDITSVVAGTGLTGGATSGAATVNVDFGTGATQVRPGNDASFTNSRTPTAHASTHATGQTDAIAPGDIGAVPTARTVSAGTGLTGGGDLSANRTLTVAYGSSAGTAAQGNDSRLSDSRTPTSHASSHQNGGGDEISVAGLSGVLADAQRADVIVATGGDLTVGAITDGHMLVRSGSTVVSAAIPTGDITSVVAGTGLTGGATSGAATVAVDFGSGSTQVRAGNDAAYTDDRTASGIRTASTTVAVSSATAPTSGQVLTATSSTAATWQDPAGDITGVTAGTGLTGGGTSGAVSVAADFGTGSGKVTQGNDSRLSDDRTGSGLRTATTVVAVSSATAPTSGQVLTATSTTAAHWADPPGGSSFDPAVNTWGATPSSANLRTAMTDETGTGGLVFATSPALVTPDLGTPSAATLTNATGLPISTGVSGLGTGVAAFLATPSSANLATAVTGETGSGALVFATSPTLVTPALGTPSSGDLTNCTALNATQLSTGTVPVDRVVSSHSAGQILRLNSGNTAIEAFTDPFQSTWKSSDQTITSGSTADIAFVAVPTITSGKNYFYRLILFAISSGGNAVLTLGNFTAGGSAAASTHTRMATRTINSSTAQGAGASNSDITTAISTITLNTAQSMVVIQGFIAASGTGTITPKVSVASFDTVFKAGCFFELRQLD